MVRRKIFGRTWWGNAWIDALNKLGSVFSNRLPRGYRYAVRGAVKKIEIRNGEVYALVQGRMPSPYEVRIRLKHFTERQIAKVRKLISEEPIISAKLLSNEMPSELEELLQKRGISILPRKTSEFNLSCSCPDWAVPCKHISAVFYILANEIDKNPFILFELRGINPDELFQGVKNDVVHRTPFLHTKKRARGKKVVEFEKINLSLKKDAKSIIFGLLPGNPLFYEHGDFKEVLERIYEKVIKKTKIKMVKEQKTDSRLRFVDCFLYFEERDYSLPNIKLLFTSEILDEEDLEDAILSLFGSDINVTRIETKNILGKKRKREFFTVDLSDVKNKLINLSLRTVASRSIRQVISMAHFAFVLLKHGYFIPDVIADAEQNFSIYYKPIYITPESRKIFDDLVIKLDERFFRTEGEFVDRESALNIFVAAMITHVVRDTFKGEYFKSTGDISNQDEITPVFMALTVYRADKFEKKNTANAVRKWLSVFQIQEFAKKPVLQLIPPKKPTEGWKLKLYFIDRTGYVPSRELLHDEAVQKVIYTLSSYYAPIAKFLKKRVSITIDIDELIELVKKKKDLLSYMGLTLMLPKESEFVTSVFPVIKFSKSGSSTQTVEGGISFLTLNDIINMDIFVQIGDEEISLSEFKKLLKAGIRAIRFKNKWIILTPEEINKILSAERFTKKKLTVRDSIRLVLAGKTTINGVKILFKPDEGLQKIIDTLKKPEMIPVPQELNGTLRDYQVRGFRWIVTNLRLGFSPCIADDMGLGKTLQVITSILHFKNTRVLKDPVLVICPTSVVGNWAREIEKFAPSLSWAIYHGINRKLDLEKDIIITSYNLVRIDFERFAKHKWGMVIIDEAQNIKNPNAQKTKAVKALNTNLRIAMTGTPIENRLLELWSIMDFLNPGYLGSRKAFIENYVIPIEKYGDLEKAEELRKIISPFILRRLKTDKNIIKDLPEKVEIDKYCRLTKEQISLYMSVVKDELKKIETKEGIGKKGEVLKLILYLKQICNHPSLFLKRPIAEIEASGKMMVLRDIVEDILASGEKLLIFTQYKEMAKLLKEMLSKEFKASIELFTGELSRKKREQIIKLFENGYIDILILTIKAGGTGLNLVSANNVVHYDLWWNPAVENQATDRAYRIGQTKNVFVYRLITEGTIEDKINELLQKKKELAEMIITSGEKWITELSIDELRELVSLST
ncbi:MAG: SNF2-related protein [Candidatus Njordarchaeia archaeon]